MCLENSCGAIVNLPKARETRGQAEAAAVTTDEVVSAGCSRHHDSIARER
jgi:uncharacterized protein YceK